MGGSWNQCNRPSFPPFSLACPYLKSQDPRYARRRYDFLRAFSAFGNAYPLVPASDMTFPRTHYCRSVDFPPAIQYMHRPLSDGHAGSLKVDGNSGRGATIGSDWPLVEKSTWLPALGRTQGACASLSTYLSFSAGTAPASWAMVWLDNTQRTASQLL